MSVHRWGAVTRSWARCVAVALVIAALPGVSAAATLTIQVDDGQGPLSDAIVSLHSPAAADAARPASAVLDQRDSQFAPHLLAISVGSEVSFPNSDNVRHHVYSFSPAKRFELPLYSGSQADPVQFERTGVVTMGCNIHDWMIAYVVVLDTPYFARSGDDGRASIELPSGDYTLRAWHERLPAGASAPERPLTVTEPASQEGVSLTLAPPPLQKPVDPRLRELQEKFRSLKREP